MRTRFCVSADAPPTGVSNKIDRFLGALVHEIDGGINVLCSDQDLRHSCCLSQLGASAWVVRGISVVHRQRLAL